MLFSRDQLLPWHFQEEASQQGAWAWCERPLAEGVGYNPGVIPGGTAG